jgi:hypothetical protein
VPIDLRDIQLLFSQFPIWGEVIEEEIFFLEWHDLLALTGDHLHAFCWRKGNKTSLNRFLSDYFNCSLVRGLLYVPLWVIISILKIKDYLKTGSSTHEHLVCTFLTHL